MPIDSKDSTFESTISRNTFCQSNSLYTFNSKPNYLALTTSKSSNCLTEELTENEDLIDKLFPKCRPKSKVSQSSECHIKKSVSNDKTHNLNHKSEMLNVPTNASSGSLADNNGTNGTHAPSSVAGRAPRKNFNSQNFDQCHRPRRTWNFMDISPSPSPPPLSPLEDSCDNSSQQYPSANYYSNSNQTSDKYSLYSTTQDKKPSSHRKYSNSTAFEHNQTNRFDINSLEINQSSVSSQDQSDDHEPNEPIHPNKETYHGRRSSHDIKRRSQAACQETGAHFRLDSLLMSPDERLSENKIVNGVHRPTRFSIDYAMNDEDDILFSRFNTTTKRSSIHSGNSFLQKDLKLNSKEQLISAINNDKISNDKPNPLDNSLYSKDCTNLRSKETVSCEEYDETEENTDDCHLATRNRIEIAGGKEIFSSSRGAKSKRRPNSGTGGQAVKANGSTGFEQRHASQHILRHSQLYSVSMAAPSATPPLTEAAAEAMANVVPSSGQESSEKEPQQTLVKQHEEQLETDSDSVHSGEDCAITTPTSQQCKPKKTQLSHIRSHKCVDHCSFDDHRNNASLKPSTICNSSNESNENPNSLVSLCAKDIHSSPHKSTMALNIETICTNSSGDNVDDEHASFVTHNEFDESAPDRNDIEAEDTICKETVLFSEPVPSVCQPEPDECNKTDIINIESTCDRFTKDLKEKFDIVSINSNLSDEKISNVSTTEQCEVNKNKFTDSFHDELDSHSVQSDGPNQAFNPNDRIARVIGSVPIAQYEGSPKRYGPKPGYPKRVLTVSSTNVNNEYDNMNVPDNMPLSKESIKDNDLLKSATFSSENGSPNSSATSSSSATFSSTDINSSSSYSCSSNRKTLGFSNYNIQSRIANINTKRQSWDDNCEINRNDDSNAELSNDDVVRSILNIPADSVEPEDNQNSPNETLSNNKTCFENKEISSDLTLNETNQHTNDEPVYSSLNFSQNQFNTEVPSQRPSSAKCLLVEDKSIKSNSEISESIGCDYKSSRSVTSLKTQPYTNDLVNLRERFQKIDSMNSTNSSASYLEGAQFNESNDSSCQSDRHSSRKMFHSNSEEDNYLYETNNYPPRETLTNGRINGNVFDANKSHYKCHPPELSNLKELHPQSKLSTESSYESSICPSDQMDIYPGILSTDKSIPEGNDCVINTMPILEDGLSSGVPSSDEMDYGEEEECEDDMVGQEQDLDDYVNEYNNNRSVVGCASDSLDSRANRSVANVGNGTPVSSDYNCQHKQSQLDYERLLKGDDGNKQQFAYRYSNKNTSNRYGLTMSEDLTSNKKESSFAHSELYHNHQLHHHLHGHSILDNLESPSTYDNTKELDNSPVQEMRNISPYSHDKYCLSSQLRNSKSNTGGSLPGRPVASHLGGKSAGHQVRSTSPPGAGSQHSHHHYHHYYLQQHSSQTLSSRQNYPNLSSSPTSLSPNSPGSIQHNPSSASSSSSSSHPPASTSQHHYHPHQQQQQPPQIPPNESSSQSQQQQQEMPVTNSPSSSMGGTAAPNVRHHHDEDCDTDQETDRLLGSQRNDERGYYDEKTPTKRSNTSREAWEPKVLIEGVLFRARYLGSTQLVCDGQPTKATRMMQAEEAVSRIKSLAPEGESQPSTEVDLFISTEKIMVLNTDLKEIMMDHALRTISYIADIGDLLVLMARRRSPIDDPNDTGIKRIPKMICHVFESEEAQYIAQSIGQAFQVAYMEFLKANGIKDSSFLKEMDYQEVLNSQEIFGDELEMFAKREKQKEVIVPKQKGEILGIVIVESGWGSMLPTVVIANLAQNSPSARCGQLNIGDQIIAINGISLVGLPLSTCQAYVKNTKKQTAVKFTIVPCAPVVEVKIKRPDTKYQLGFSVQNGVICSLLRGGIAERGGVRVGHRIIEINGQSVVAVPHDRIVNLLATSVGEIHMKTMPTSMFRLLTGQESPSFM